MSFGDDMVALSPVVSTKAPAIAPCSSWYRKRPMTTGLTTSMTRFVISLGSPKTPVVAPTDAEPSRKAVLPEVLAGAAGAASALSITSAETPPSPLIMARNASGSSLVASLVKI